MRRRNREINWIGLAGPLAGLVILGMMISDQARLALVRSGAVVAVALGLLFISIVAWALFRRRGNSSKIQLATFNSYAPPQQSSPPVVARPAQLLDQRSHAVVNPRPSAEQLITQIRSVDWFQFEKLVALIYRKAGFTVSRRGGANADGGIDLILQKDGERTAVQCKQWKTWNVGVKAVREFLGALTDANISKGIFITLCGYTADAKALAEKHGIAIINESGLAKLIESSGAAVDPETTQLLADKRKFCPKCESEMVLRVAKKGPNPGQKFWGCSKYPRCHYILDWTPQSSDSFASPRR